MESDMFMVMLFLFFFFLGILLLFWYFNHRLARQLQELSEEHAQLRVLLRALESRLEGVAALENVRPTGADKSTPQGEASSGHDPLLHLSFDKNSLGESLHGDAPLKLD